MPSKTHVFELELRTNGTVLPSYRFDGATERVVKLVDTTAPFSVTFNEWGQVMDLVEQWIRTISRATRISRTRPLAAADRFKLEVIKVDADWVLKVEAGTVVPFDVQLNMDANSPKTVQVIESTAFDLSWAEFLATFRFLNLVQGFAAGILPQPPPSRSRRP